ncbi:AraC family transcriptional regulator [Prolixibacteraceae bacterium JC049]|nr:AraC family transcriptional regulator [Prolixibacteraceae bacterium JC049]
MSEIMRVSSISQLHGFIGYDKPLHPMVTLIDFSKVDVCVTEDVGQAIFGLYGIIFKKTTSSNFKYGRKDYDFNEAALLCIAPEQLLATMGYNVAEGSEGWGLFFHSDLIRCSFLNEKIKDYTFFSYDMNEALHLSEQENDTLLSVLKTIQHEYSINMDNVSTDLIISNIEMLLNYCKRFYGRQFITRSTANHSVVKKFEQLVAAYFENENCEGLPSVKYCAENLNLSPNYLSDLLKQETGKSAIEHIHYHLIDRAKNLLVNTTETVSEIAYSLGFEQPQSFSKLFKKKMGVTPGKFRNKR